MSRCRPGTVSIRLEMENWWAPDPPGTINPAKLSRQIGAPPDTIEGFQTSCPPTHFDKETTPEAARQSIPSTAPRPTVPRSAVPLPRISSDWDPEHDIVVHGNSRHQDMQMEFEDFHVAKRPPIAVRARRTSHRGHFRSQTEGGMRVQVPVDLSAGPGATVVIHSAAASIYDAYLLKADIMKNVNIFRRHQVRQAAYTSFDDAKPLTRCSSIDSIQPGVQNVHSFDPRGTCRAPRPRQTGNGVKQSKACRSEILQDVSQQDGHDVDPKIRTQLRPGQALYVRRARLPWDHRTP